MRLAVINRDKPFLVDSVAATIAAHGLAIDRVLHPVVPVARDKDGALLAIGKKAGKDAEPESMIYMEIERADAKDRRALVAAIRNTLGDVRAAVRDWPKMQATLRADAESLGDTEGAAGSIYIEFPVTVTGILAKGGGFHLSGPMTLKRVNDVDGSTAQQRRWHISSSGLKPRP